MSLLSQSILKLEVQVASYAAGVLGNTGEAKNLSKIIRVVETSDGPYAYAVSARPTGWPNKNRNLE